MQGSIPINPKAFEMMRQNKVGVIDYTAAQDAIAQQMREAKQDDSSFEEGELNSAQKQKLKNDLLRMGYDEDEEEFGVAPINDVSSDEDDDEIPQAAATQQNLLKLQQQQQQFDEAMRIQMAMKMQVNGQGIVVD